MEPEIGVGFAHALHTGTQASGLRTQLAVQVLAITLIISQVTQYVLTVRESLALGLRDRDLVVRFAAPTNGSSLSRCRPKDDNR